MYQIILNKTQRDPDYPDRYYPLMIYKKVLDGTLYDCFDRQYHEEYMLNGQQYIPEHERAPCVNSGLNLMRSVVEESVSFLFGEDRFPDFLVEDDDTREFIKRLVKDTKMVQVFQDAATRGSIGSAAIHLKVSKQRFFLKVYDSLFLTPVYDKDEPDKLVSITERRKVLGSDLVALGYDIPEKNLNDLYWFHRFWDDREELWYQPYLRSDAEKKDFSPKRDDERSTVHSLGFVPWIWITNLVGSGNDIDGRCTFEPALENAVQIDYAMSRVDRALKYNSDPLTVIKVRNPEQLEDFNKDGGNALVIGVEGDAKLLETSGNAAESTIAVVDQLRSEAMAAIHGSRANPDKLATSNSSVAQRLLYSPMVRLASHLRVQYGDDGVLPLINMMMRIAAKRQSTSLPMMLLGKTAPKVKVDEDVHLIWADWFPSTPFDIQLLAQSWVPLVQAGIVSKQTALENMRTFVDFGDIDTELEKIKSEQDEDQDRQVDLQTELTKAMPKSVMAKPAAKKSNV